MAANPLINNLIHDNLMDKKAGEIVDTSQRAVGTLWHYPILNADKNPVTIGSLTIAIVALFIGLWYFDRLKPKIKNFLHKKFGDDKDAANAIQNIITYLILIVFITIVLQIANIPLSTFAFIGGALAIGVGLGAQNLINNFISSLIIMVERPIKMGDSIQIDHIYGKVVSMGARCVTVQTDHMTDILVPNSKIIQESLVNWSLLDSYIKVSVDIKFYKNHFCKIFKETGDNPIGDQYKKVLDGSCCVKPNIEEVLKQLEEVFYNFPELTEKYPPKGYFMGVDNCYYNYQIIFSYDTKKILDSHKLKSDINIQISKHFDIESFIIECSNMDVK